MVSVLLRRGNASCATPPPSGQECHDTVAIAAGMPWWAQLLVVAVGGVVVGVAAYFGTRAQAE